MYSYIIVDDEPLIRRGLRKKLEKIADRAVCCGEAGNGRAALELMKQLHPDIVITDMKMPLMDGKELLPVIAEQFPDVYIIVISGYRDFEYTRHAIRANAIDYQLKPVKEEELIASVKRAIAMKEEKNASLMELTMSRSEKEQQAYLRDMETLTNLLLGYRVSSHELFSRRFQDLIREHWLLVLTVHGNHPLDAEKMEKTFLGQELAQQVVYLQHTHTDRLGFFLLFFPENFLLSEEQLGSRATEKILAACMSAGMSVTVGISKKQESVESLHEAFLETVNALDQSLITEENRYYFSGEREAVQPIVWEQEQRLLFHIEAGKGTDVQADLDGLFQEIGKQPGLRLSDVKEYGCILSEKIRYLASLSLESVYTGKISENSRTTLNTLFSLSELEAYYRQLFGNISAALLQEHFYTSADITENIRTYVERNYFQDLSVEFIASLFHLNRNYCSTVFRQKTGYSLIGYINEVRIFHAKKLLSETDRRLSQISQAAGYDNVKYFFRIFKKYTGLSPEQYRKQCREK